MRLKKDEGGFSTLEGILVIVVLVVIAAVGYYVYHSQNKASNNYSASQSSGSVATDPYASWNTVKLTTAKVSYRYPVSWKAGSVSSSSDGDSVTLTGSKGYTLDVSYSKAGSSLAASGSVLYAAPLTLSGQKVYLDYLGSAGNVDSVALSKSATEVVAPVVNGFNVDVNGQYPVTAASLAVNKAKADINYRDTALVVSSAKTVK